MAAEEGSIKNGDLNANSNEITVEKSIYTIAPDREKFINEYFVSEKGEELTERKVDLEVEMKTHYDPKNPNAKVGAWKTYHIRHIYRVYLRFPQNGQSEEIKAETTNGNEIVLWEIVNGEVVNPTRIFDNELYMANQRKLNLSGNKLITLFNRLFKKK